MSKSQREKGIIISYITMAFNFAIGIVFTPFITRMLGTSEYGLYNLATSIITYLTMLDLGFGNSMIRFTSRCKASDDKQTENKINGMFLMMFSVISVIALIIGIVIYFNIEPFFNKFTPEETERAKIIFLILLVNICFSFPFTVISAQLSANEKFSFLKTYNLAVNAIKYLLEAIVMYSGFKAVGVAVAAVSVSILSKIVPIIYCKKNLDIHFSFDKFDKELFKEIITYSSFIFINILVDQLYANTDKIILGKVTGTAAVAIYGIAANFNKDFNQFSTSISGVFLPNITKLITKKVPINEISNIFIKIARIQFIILGIVFSGFFLFGKTFIHYWLGDGYSEAYSITLILMLPGMISLTQNIGISILQALNKHKIRSVMYLAIAVINIILSIPLAIKWSGFGAAIGTLIGNILGQILFMNWYYWKKVGLDIPKYWKSVFLKIGSMFFVYSGIWFVISRYIDFTSITGLIIGILLYVLFLLPVLLYMMLEKEEREFVFDKVKNIKKLLIRK